MNAFEKTIINIYRHANDALLLQKAIPGSLLKNYFPKQTQNAIKIACDVTKRLHQAPLPKENHFPHIKEWLRSLDREWDIPRFHLEQVRSLKNTLLETQTAPMLLHGDLHQDNILSHGKDWLVIDPKGVIGSPINE